MENFKETFYLINHRIESLNYLCKALQHSWKHITNKHRKQISERVDELIKLKQTN